MAATAIAIATAMLHIVQGVCTPSMIVRRDARDRFGAGLRFCKFVNMGGSKPRWR
jgi:hypothetical protein